MSFTVKANFNKTRAQLEARLRGFDRAAESVMNQAGFIFIGQMVKKWYTGRRSDGMGLNRQTGALADRWSVFTKTDGGIINTKIQSGVRYSTVHEKGDRSKGIPKRTDLNADMKSLGKEIFLDMLKSAARSKI